MIKRKSSSLENELMDAKHLLDSLAEGPYYMDEMRDILKCTVEDIDTVLEYAYWLELYEQMQLAPKNDL